MSDVQEYEQEIPDFNIDFLSDPEATPPQPQEEQGFDDARTVLPDDLEAKEQEAAQTEKEPEGPPLIPPARWSQEAKDAFHKWPREAQEQILARNKDMEGDYTNKTKAVAQERKEFEELKQQYSDIDTALKPYVDDIRRAGFTPAQIITQTMAYHDLARKDPHGFIREFVQQNQIDPLTLFDQNGQFQQQQMDPYTQQVMEQNQQLQQQFQQLQTQMQQQQESERLMVRSSIAQDIEAFRLAADEQGNPMHPYFEHVKDDMTALIRSGQAQDLPDAYNKAIRLNDDVYHAMQQQQQQAIARQRREEQVNQSLKAQHAAASAPSSPMGSNQASEDNSSVRDALNASLSEAGFF